MDVNRIANHPYFVQSPLATELERAPLGFVDIGARGDIHPLVAPLARHVGVMGFEPDADECARLRARYAQGSPWHVTRFEPIALAEKPGNHAFYRLRAATNDSLRRVNNAVAARYGMTKFEEIGRGRVATARLDDVLFSSSHPVETFWGELVKLDTQGTEYEILKGARKTLQQRTLGVVCEVAFFDIYRGQKLFSDIERMMRRLGFSFYGFTMLILRSGKRIDKRASRGRERYMYADAVFLKDPYAGNARVPALGAAEKRRLLLIALLLEYYDLCMELAEDLWQGAELAGVWRLIEELASAPAQTAMAEVEELASSMRRQPALGNVLAGRFIKSRFGYFDHDDVIIESDQHRTNTEPAGA